jgi:hypothetical protein
MPVARREKTQCGQIDHSKRPTETYLVAEYELVVCSDGDVAGGASAPDEEHEQQADEASEDKQELHRQADRSGCHQACRV